MEQVVNAMPSVTPNDTTPLSSSYGLTTGHEMTSIRKTKNQMKAQDTCPRKEMSKERTNRSAWHLVDPERESSTHMALPRSRNSAPGLHSAIAASRHCRVVRISFFESSEILPTGYVSYDNQRPKDMSKVGCSVVRTQLTLRSPWNPKQWHSSVECSH
jgi:hypothetical protein